MKTPNIIQIIWHDLGDYLGCYGRAGIRSPELDRFAAEGVIFRRMFATSSHCSPSRGSIMTGRYPHANGLMGLAQNGWHYHAGQETLGHVLKRYGYRTVLCGLQHELSHLPEAKTRSVLGYDEILPAQSHACIHVAPEACRFIRARQGGSRFFLSVGFQDVHRPYEKPYADEPSAADIETVTLPPYMIDHEETRRDFARFGKLIETADRHTGMILDAIREAGLEKDTLVFFTTDHGPPFNRAKGTCYDPGLKVAALFRWTGRIPAGTEIAGLASNLDIMPTLLEMCGLPVPGSVQGIPLVPALLDGERTGRSQVIGERNYTTHYDPMRAIRTERWKYIWNKNHQEPMYVLTPHARITGFDRISELYGHPRPETELYDLQSDSDETENLSGRDDFRDIEQDLRSRLLAVLEETGDPLLGGDIEAPRKLDPRYEWIAEGGRLRFRSIVE